jgi:hypothetical protein
MGAGSVQRRVPRSASRIAYRDRVDAADLQTAARSSSMIPLACFSIAATMTVLDLGLPLADPLIEKGR